MSRIPLKTPAELDKIRMAGHLAATVLQDVAAAVTPGITTLDLDNVALASMERLKVRSAFLGYMGYPAQCCISVNEEIIHGIPGKRQIQDGDVVSIDVGVWYEGFAGDNALTVKVGDCSPDIDRLLSRTEAALLAGVAACRPGARIGDVSRAVELVAIKSGLAVVREFVGHGIGRSLHEDPQVPNFGPARQGSLLKPGMVICIEPMFNLGVRSIRSLPDGWTVVTRDGKPSAHFEHMVAITQDGHEILSPRQPLYQ